MPWIKRQKGVVFFTTLILLSLAVLTCSGVTVMMLRDTYTVNRLKNSMKAYFLAEAGIETAIKEMKNDFAWAPPASFPALGEGTYTVSVTAFGLDESRKLITSTGTVNGVERILKVQVTDNRPPSFNYALMSGSQMWLWGFTTITGDAHANSNRTEWWNPAMDIGLLLPVTINGDASACGFVLLVPWAGTVNPGPPVSNAPAVALPPFDANFFQYYYNLANADGKAYTVDKTFTSDPCVGGNHVVYVNGNVTLQGSWTMTGCIVATGSITFPFRLLQSWTITQNQWQNLPALISRDGTITIASNMNLHGMVYAGGDIIMPEFGRTMTQTGCCYARGSIFLRRSTVNYVMPNPPGLAIPIGLSVLSWSEG